MCDGLAGGPREAGPSLLAGGTRSLCASPKGELIVQRTGEKMEEVRKHG